MKITHAAPALERNGHIRRGQTVFIIGGGGMAGATAAQCIALKEIVREVVLIDVAEELVRSQAADISHATAYTSGVRVRVGDYSDIQENDIIVIASGLSMASRGVRSRLDLLDANVEIVADVVFNVMAQGKLVYLLVVTNPVDILTYTALRASGLPKQRVFGTGTLLDTARLHVAIAHKLHVSPQEVQAYVLGEHGDSSFPALSHATIGGIPLAQFPGYLPGDFETIDRDIRNAALEIIEVKKSTNYGIGNVVAKLVEAIVHDAGTVYPVSSLATGEYGLDDVPISLPTLVNGTGVQILPNYPLNREEMRQLHASARVIAR